MGARRRGTELEHASPKKTAGWPWNDPDKSALALITLPVFSADGTHKSLAFRDEWIDHVHFNESLQAWA